MIRRESVWICMWQMRAEGRQEGFAECMEQDAKAMYEEGIAPDVIARIQKVPVEVIEKIPGLRPV